MRDSLLHAASDRAPRESREHGVATAHHRAARAMSQHALTAQALHFGERAVHT